MTDFKCDNCGKMCVTEDDHQVTPDGRYLCMDCLKMIAETYDPTKEHPYAEKWTGNIRDLVKKVRYSDARYSAIDAKSGAHIRLNLDSDALMYIESPNGENLHDALSMREAEHILSAYRKGKPYLI